MVYNPVRALIQKAAGTQHVAIQSVSFVHALPSLRGRVHTPVPPTADEALHRPPAPTTSSRATENAARHRMP